MSFINEISDISLCKKRKEVFSVGPIEVLFLYFVVWSAGGASSFQKLLYSFSPDNIFSICTVFICLYLLHKYRIKIFNKKLITLIGFFLVCGTIGTIIEGENKQYFYIIYNIFISYTLIAVFKKDLFIYYEKIVVFFSIISLISFFLVILLPSISSIVSMFSVIKSTNTMESNVFLFGFAPIDPEVSIIFPRRNLGFAWEPGRYSVIVIFALYFNLVNNKMRIRQNKNFWILLVTLITTQSTTGYFCLIVPCLLYMYNTKYKIYVIPFLFLFLASASTLSFLGDKLFKVINWQANQDNNFNSMVDYYSSEDIVYVPQRMEGLFYDYLNFVHDFWFGYGPDFKKSYVSNVLFKGGLIYSSNGILQIFASCGFIVGLLFYYLLYLSSKKISSDLEYKGTFIFFVLFVLISISYNFWYITIFLTFILYGYFTKEKNC